MSKLHVGDAVYVRSGKDRGKTGKITKIAPKTAQVWVEGVHLVKRHQKKSAAHPQGGIVEKHLPLPASVVAKSDKEPTQTKKATVKKKEDSK